jgi:hypothetical protein
VSEKSSDEGLNQSNEPIKPTLEEVVQSPDSITTQVKHKYSIFLLTNSFVFVQLG